MGNTNTFKVEPYVALGDADIIVINSTGELLLDGKIWHKHGQNVYSKLMFGRLQNNEVYNDRVSISFIWDDGNCCSDFAGDLWCISFCDRNKRIWRNKSDAFVLVDAIRRSVHRYEDKDKDKEIESGTPFPDVKNNDEYLAFFNAALIAGGKVADYVKGLFSSESKLLTNETPMVKLQQKYLYKEVSDYFSKNGRPSYDVSDAYYRFDIDPQCITGLGYGGSRIYGKGKNVVIEIKKNDSDDFYLVVKNDGSDSNIQKNVDMIDVTTLPVDATLF